MLDNGYTLCRLACPRHLQGTYSTHYVEKEYIPRRIENCMYIGTVTATY